MQFSLKKIITKNNPEITGFVLIALIWSLWPLRNYVYFKDYGIIWEAAYRINLGQIPFIDFSSPVGPGSFLIPAIIFKLFGSTWQNLQFSQLIQSSILLLSAYFILKKTGVMGWNLSNSLILFTLLYLIFLSHPWYNSTATLFFFISLAITLTSNHYSFFISGIFAGLTFLTKQDIGVMNIFSICLITIFINSKINFDKKLINLALCLTGALLIILNFALIIGIQQFNYWLQRSLLLASLRGNEWRDFIYNSPILIISIISFIEFIKTKEKILLYATVLLLSAFVEMQTKAIYYTSFFYTLILYPIVQYFYHNSKLWLFILIPFICFSILSPVASLKNLTLTTMIGAPEPFRFKHDLVTKIVEPAPSSIKSLAGILAPPETYDVINQIKKITAEMHIVNGHEPTLLNISEITSIYYEVNIMPPKNMPLWFDPKLLISKSEEELIYKKINNNEFDIIIFQTTYADQSSKGYVEYSFYNNIFQLLNNNKNYFSLSKEGFYSPDSSIHGCASKKNCFNHMIFVFVHNKLLK
jgi:hypothetical protein